jgi:hypothetical protein
MSVMIDRCGCGQCGEGDTYSGRMLWARRSPPGAADMALIFSGGGHGMARMPHIIACPWFYGLDL